MKLLGILLVVLLLLIAGIVFRHEISKSAASMAGKPKKTVADRVAEHGTKARERLAPYFKGAGVTYPPEKIVLLGIKDQKRLELYAVGGTSSAKLIRSWPILAASGEPGPKLREGDYQVPEGIYPIELLNPNSSYHLSMRIGYPNGFDRERARRDGRSNLGGDIMIHGNAVSIGCLAMGDEAAEDLFVLAADTGLPRISVILTPVDFRVGATVPASPRLPSWSGELYASIKTELARLPKP